MGVLHHTFIAVVIAGPTTTILAPAVELFTDNHFASPPGTNASTSDDHV